MYDKQQVELNKLLSIYNNIPSVIYVSDPETHELVFANKKAKALFGEDLIGKQCYKVLQGFDKPCDFCTNDILFEQPEKAYEWEYKNSLTNKTYAINDVLIDWPDGRKLRLEIALDITDRKEIEEKLLQSEERFNLALSAAEEGIWDWDILTNSVYFSPQWKAQIGYHSDELKNDFDTWKNQLHPDDTEKTLETLNAYLANPEGKFIVEFRLRHKDGSYRWIRNQAASTLNEQKEVIRMFGAHSDITEIKQKSELLEQQKQKAEQADMFKSAFLANMSHDLRTPLNSIIGFSELLNLTEKKEDQENYTSIIRQNGQILLSLVDDIIDISKIEAGKLKLYKTHFDLDEFMDRIESIYIERLNNDQKLEVIDFKKITPFIPLHLNLKTDEARLFQIFTNLINNAIKFTDNGFIHFGYQSHNNNIEFFVKDSGIGIEEDQLQLIFERFGQVEDTISRNTKGTGLGLSICKQLTKILGGEIRIDSTIGKGTSIYFTFQKKALS